MDFPVFRELRQGMGLEEFKLVLLRMKVVNFQVVDFSDFRETLIGRKRKVIRRPWTGELWEF